MICKHCEQNFNFKNKLHEHIREQHTQKSNINSNFRFSTSKSTYKIEKKSTIICSSVSFASSTFSATSRNQIFSTKSASRFVSSNNSNLSIATHKLTFKFMKKSTSFVSFVSSILSATSTSIFDSISSKCSHFSIATLNITSKQTEIASMLTTRDFTSKRVEIATFNCSFTFSISFSRTSVSKFYFIIDDLIRMFREKFKSFDLRQYQKDFAFSQRFDIRSSRQSRIFY